MGRKSKAIIRKQEILRNFYEVMKEEGYEGTSIAKVAKRMDVNPSLLIHYFNTKTDITYAFTDYLIEQFQTHIPQLTPEDHDPKERMELFIGWLVGERPLAHKDVSIFYNLLAVASRDSYIEDCMGRLLRAWQAFIEQELTTAYESKLSTIDPPRRKRMTDLLLSYYVGNQMQRYFEASMNESEQQSQRKLLQALLSSPNETHKQST